MGTDKAFLPRVSGQGGTWLGAAVDCLKDCVAEVLVVGRRQSDLAEVTDIDWKDVSVRADHRNGIGPLAGVETGLLAARPRGILTLPCDLPYLESSTLQLLLSAAEVGAQQTMCFVQPDGRLEAAVAIYGPEAFEPLLEFLDGGGRSVTRFLHRLGFEAVAVPPDLTDQFRNVNTPEDLRELDA